MNTSMAIYQSYMSLRCPKPDGALETDSYITYTLPYRQIVMKGGSFGAVGMGAFFNRGAQEGGIRERNGMIGQGI